MEIKKMTYKGNLRFISWSLILFSLGLLFFIALLIASYQKTGSVQWLESLSLVGPYFIVMSIVAVPGFFLHYKYYQQDKDKSLRFRPTYFEITQNHQVRKIYYKDILHIEKHYPVWNHRMPWSSYGYIRILLRDNSIYSYSCLTHDIVSSAILFKNKGVVVEDCAELYP